jgi:hypothetical protein
MNPLEIGGTNLLMIGARFREVAGYDELRSVIASKNRSTSRARAQ